MIREDRRRIAIASQGGGDYRDEALDSSIVNGIVETHQKVRDLPLPADLKIAEVNGASLACREQGAGQPVVFVHGSIT